MARVMQSIQAFTMEGPGTRIDNNAQITNLLKPGNQHQHDSDSHPLGGRCCPAATTVHLPSSNAKNDFWCQLMLHSGLQLFTPHFGLRGLLPNSHEGSATLPAHLQRFAMDANGPTDQKHGHDSQPRRVVVVRGDGALRSGARILPMFVAAWFSRRNFQFFLRGCAVRRNGKRSELRAETRCDV